MVSLRGEARGRGAQKGAALSSGSFTARNAGTRKDLDRERLLSRLVSRGQDRALESREDPGRDEKKTLGEVAQENKS